MSKTILEVKYLTDEGDALERIEKDKLDLILQHQPIIEIDGKTYNIDQVNYDVVDGIFYIHLTDR